MRTRKVWNYQNLNKLIDMVAERVNKEGHQEDAQQLSVQSRREVASGYYYGYAKCLGDEKEIPKSVDAVTAMINFIVSYQKPEEMLMRHKNAMKFNASVIIYSRFRLNGEHGISVVEKSMSPKLKYMKVA